MSMTEDEMRIAILEKVAGVPRDQIHNVTGRGLVYWIKTEKGPVERAVPNYPRDLNAIREVESVLTNEQWNSYVNFQLRCAVAEEHNEGCVKLCGTALAFEIPWLVHASALQRCEALCRVWWPEKLEDDGGDL